MKEVEELVAKLLGEDCEGEVPKAFAKWVGIYVETIALDPATGCACVDDPSCVETLDRMLLELMELDDYEVTIRYEEARKVLEACRST